VLKVRARKHTILDEGRNRKREREREREKGG
jgi:hypothetical protein